jgi:hypothetical protein
MSILKSLSFANDVGFLSLRMYRTSLQKHSCKGDILIMLQDDNLLEFNCTICQIWK